MTKASGVTEENAPTLFAPVHVHALSRPLGEGEREGAALTARDFGKLAPARALVVRELLCARAMPEWLDSSVEPATILALLRALLPPSDGPPAADESDAPFPVALSLACITLASAAPGCRQTWTTGREKHPICDMCKDEKLPTTYMIVRFCAARTAPRSLALGTCTGCSTRS